MSVAQKTQLKIIDATPEKRLFLSIISDYNLKTGLCELIDNALDHWVANGKKTKLNIEIDLNSDRQIISVTDNAGGVKQENLGYLVTPGASGNKVNSELIGIFGVGSKRAGVALGEQVEIQTRYKKDKSLQIDITSDWIGSHEWTIATYEIPHITPSTTVISISKLRQGFSEDDVDIIQQHIAETYAWFLVEGVEIAVNKTTINPVVFDEWAYPPEFKPRVAKIKLNPTGKGELSTKITAGLIRDRNPETDNYGVYFYCNHRLIVKELRSRDVGYFVSSEAGVPHPDASLCRVIIDMQGPAELMPWNSSKSGISFTHAAFLQTRPTLINLVSYYSSLSRRLKKEWEDRVFKYTRGNIEQVPAAETNLRKKLILPTLPRAHKSRIESLKSKNKKILEEKPWTLGIIEAMGMVDLVIKQNLETKNRIALILLDSNFEIGLKEFIVNRTDLFRPDKYSDAKILEIFRARHTVLNEVKAHINIPPQLLTKTQHYYNLRNKLIHERATVGITDSQIKDYKKTTEAILKLLFGIQFSIK